MAIIAVCNLDPVTGKTTTAISLAEALGRFGARVLIIDLTPDHDVTVAIQRVHSLDLAEVLERKLPLQTSIGGSTLTGVDLLTLPSVPLETLFGGSGTVRANLQDLLRRASSGYTYVFMDLPASAGDPTGAALRIADVALVPLPAEEESLADAARMVRALDDLRQRERLPLKIALLITMVAPEPGARRVAAELRATYPRFVLPTAIPLDDVLQGRIDRLPGGRILSHGENAYHQAAVELSERLSASMESAGAHAG